MVAGAVSQSLLGIIWTKWIEAALGELFLSSDLPWQVPTSGTLSSFRELVPVCERAVGVYRQWLREAKSAVLCWKWMARDLGVAKDIRRIIADLIWQERSLWGDLSCPRML